MPSHARATVNALALIGALLPFAALSQAYPVKPINLLSGASVGSAGDTAMRVVTARMSETIGQPIVVEARRGAGGLSGHATLLRFAAHPPPREAVRPRQRLSSTWPGESRPQPPSATGGPRATVRV